MKILKLVLLLGVAILLFCCKKTRATGETTTITPPVQPPVTGTDTSKYPAYNWQEHWGEHKQLVQRVYLSDNVAIYYDKDVNRDVTWPFLFFDSVWTYVKRTYGDFGKQVGQDDRLYAILHTDKYGGGHPACYFNEDHDLRNVLDVGQGGGTDAWKEQKGWSIGASVHEIGHIVEGGSNGVRESPAFDIWGDSKWCEIFVYDVYKNIGLKQDAADVKAQCPDISDSYPVRGTQWFRDWFFPIYDQYGGAQVYSRYFKSLATNFPKSPFRNVFWYNRRMDMGEFVHFMSGAAGTNLQPMAAKAFGWSAEWTTMFQTAKTRFPAVTYTGINDALVVPPADINITPGGTLSVSKEHPNGNSAAQGSAALVDDNDDTKFYLGSYTSDFYAIQQFSAPVKVTSYMLTTGDDVDERDPKDFELEGSADKATWTSLDVQSTKKFETRKGSYRYRLTNQTAYQYYRLKIKAVKSGSAMQLGEWRLYKN